MKFGLIGITGEQGDGKTALATKIAIEEYDMNPKRKIIANYKINGIKSLVISFYDVVTMIHDNQVPLYIHDVNGDQVDFIKLYKKTYKKEPLSVDDIFKDAILIFDELHIVADAYDFLGSSARVLSTFITQVRKRGIIFIGVTQHLNQVVKRIRNHLQYVIDVQKTDMPGISFAETYGGRLGNELLKAQYIDLSPFFHRYDSNQLIAFKP